MKNLIRIIFLTVLLGLVGCASNTNQSPTAGYWQYRTFTIVANNDFDFRN